MGELAELKKEITKIERRNRKVEADKAWETSWTRTLLISFLTYIAIVSYFYFAQLPRPWLNSVVPAIAFVLSTLTIPHFKKYWIKYLHRPKHPLERD